MKFIDYCKSIDCTREKRCFLLLAVAGIIVYFVGWIIRFDFRDAFYAVAYAVLFLLLCLNSYALTRKLECAVNEMSLRLDKAERK